MTMNEPAGSGTESFTEEQKAYLEGFLSGQAALRAAQGGTLLGTASPAGPAAPAGPEAIHYEAQNRAIAAGGKLVAEEQAKRRKNPLDAWDDLAARAKAGVFPKGTDVFVTKFHGLFYVAPAQDSFMCRLRIPNGILTAFQFRAVADLAARHGGGYAHVTTRANLQIREIPATAAIDILTGLSAAGLTSRGSGADNIRNITGNPTAGIDPQELVDTRSLGLELHHYVLNHREMYGLPRKFNIAFDGGGAIAALEDTNDIGFTAVRVPEGRAVPAGVWFRVSLGGITGHGDFATDAGVVVRPDQCTAVAAAIVRVFIAEGDRTDRQKARMKYVLDRIGHAAYFARVEAEIGEKLPRLALSECEPRPPIDRGGHVGFHRQRQKGFWYAGIATPVGRLTVGQMHGLAEIAERHGDGDVRLTVWQNLLLSGIPDASVPAVRGAVERLGLRTEVSAVRAGMVACTGSRGCKFAASDTKAHAMRITGHVEARVALDVPVNIHLTGCHHSCAQHYIGDIGLLATKVPVGEDGEIEGYHLHVGGGYGSDRAIAREVLRDVPADGVAGAIERLLASYLAHRTGPAESFHAFGQRHTLQDLRDFCAEPHAAAARSGADERERIHGKV
jgi:ferredoxin-nitrite reductase